MREREEQRYKRIKMAMNKHLSIITLNVNGLNTPIKRYRIAECIRNHDPHICCLQYLNLRTKELQRLEVKGWKKIYSKQMDRKKANVAILISDKIDFKTKARKRGTEEHFKKLKRRIHQEDINIINTGAPKYMRKILEDFKKDIDNSTLRGF